MNNMNWVNLSKGLCPKCSNELIKAKKGMTCFKCLYRLSYEKYLDLSKGKESKAYKEKVKYYNKIKQYNKTKKQKENQIFNIQKQERLDNLKRMLGKGLISIEEYNLKSCG